MPERPGGFGKEDIDEGYRALFQAKDLDGIKRSIETLPVLRSQIFQSQFRQLRLTFQKDPGEAFSNFLSVYDAFFTALHYWVFFRQIDAGLSQRTGPVSPNTEPYAPPYYLELARQLEGRLPPDQGPTYDPAKDGQLIRDELSRVVGKDVALIEYARSAGTLWCAVVVKCARCGQLRLAIRANLIDLTLASELGRPLHDKRINADKCTACGDLTAIPARVWVEERPGPLDPLACLTCAWLLRPSVVVYQPPAGTARDPEYDRVLEVRLDILLRQLCHSIFERDRPGIIDTPVAYDLDEICYFYERSASDRLMNCDFLIQEIVQKIESGILPPYQAEQFIRNLPLEVLKEWPLVTTYAAGSSVEALVRNLVSEACAEAQQAPRVVRALLAGSSSQFYTALGQIGNAQTALARADTLLSEVSSGEPGFEEIKVALTNIRSELMSATDRHEEADKLRKTVLRSRAGRGDSLLDRLNRWQGDGHAPLIVFGLPVW